MIASKGYGVTICEDGSNALNSGARAVLKDQLMIKNIDAGERGFTLVELIVVLFILGVLASVVSMGVIGLMGRGGAEAYATDEGTIQVAVSIFFSDVHAYSNTGGWNESPTSADPVHNFPTWNGLASTLYHGNETYIGKHKVSLIVDSSDNLPATRQDVIRAAIWMGLLTNSPGSGTPGQQDEAPPYDTGQYLNAPLAGENGPYLNSVPKSCSEYNIHDGKGSIIWIMGEYGRVYGVFEESGLWYGGFGGRYP